MTLPPLKYPFRLRLGDVNSSSYMIPRGERGGGRDKSRDRALHHAGSRETWHSLS